MPEVGRFEVGVDVIDRLLEPSMSTVEGLAIEAVMVLCVARAALGIPEHRSYAFS